MAQATDLLLDEDGDLMLKEGNLVIGYSDGQHIQHLFEIEPGELKENVLVGVGLIKKQHGPLDGGLRREASLQLEADGYRLNTPLVLEKNSNGTIKISIDAQRID
ncbi:MAG TPA: hypothetical protein PKC39_14500 [Ferruginibacter sp.]|nr:hypothetical protein [Ferruginibacter sp.]HMP22166.1 hypothetical protein [Ferruginibacter sp.]